MKELRSDISVDVIMACFNCEQTVMKAISSILETRINVRLMVIDDCSTDSTLEVLSLIDDPRVKVFRNLVNLGLSNSLNILIEKSNAKYIARMDADDVVVNNRFERQVEFLEKNKTIDVCGTWALGKHSDGSEVLLKRPLLHKDLMDKMHIRPPFIHPTVMAKSGFFRKNQYDVRFRRAQDWELFSRRPDLYCYANLDFVGLEYMVSSGLSFKSLPIRYLAALLASYRSGKFIYGIVINSYDLLKVSIGIALRRIR